jgi:hypothetical protein
MATTFTASRALRVLGQALEKMGVEVFDIRSSDDYFYVQYGDPAPPHLEILETTFSQSDLRSLEYRARADRQKFFNFVDFNGLAEILRAAGRYVESKDGQLLRVCNCESVSELDAVNLEYATRDSRTWVEEFSQSTMSDYAMRMYKERSRIQQEHAHK